MHYRATRCIEYIQAEWWQQNTDEVFEVNNNHEFKVLIRLNIIEMGIISLIEVFEVNNNHEFKMLIRLNIIEMGIISLITNKDL